MDQGAATDTAVVVASSVALTALLAVAVTALIEFKIQLRVITVVLF